MSEAIASVAAPAAASSTSTTQTAAPTSAPAQSTGQPLLSGAEPSWHDSLPPDMRSHASLAKFKDVGTLAKSYTEMEKTMGSRVQLPQETWTPEQTAEFYGKLGRPQKPEGYEFQSVSGELPPGLVHSPEQDKWFASLAHKHNLSKAQANAIRNDFIEYQVGNAKGSVEAQQKRAAAETEGIASLERELGPEFKPAIARANTLLKEFGGKETMEFIKENGLSNNPVLTRFLVKLGKAMTDHSVIRGLPSMTGAFATDPGAASSEINRLKSDRTFVNTMTNPRAAGHKEAVEKWNQLHKVAYGVDV